MTPLLLLVLALILSASVSSMLVRAGSAGQLGFMDRPDARKVHDHPIPRTGGIAVYIGSMAPLISQLGPDPLLTGYAAGATVLVFFGLIDDYRGLDFRLKFLGQILASLAMLLISGVGIRTLGQVWPGVELGIGLLWPLVTIFFLLTTINAINFSDGLDGLAGGISLLILACVAVLAFLADRTTVVVISLCVTGGLIGFLRLNVHPAIIFMGDTGSQLLGYTVGVCLIALTQHASIYSPILPLFLLGTPLLDMVMVIFQRLTNRQSIFRPDKNHLHHKLLLNGFDHAQSVTLIHGGNLVLLALAFSLRFSDDGLIMACYLWLVLSLIVAVVAIRKSLALRQGIQHVLLRGFRALQAGAIPLYGTVVLAKAAWVIFAATFAATFLFLPTMITDLGPLESAGILSIAILGTILYFASQRWFDPFLRLTAYFAVLLAIITQASYGDPSSQASMVGKILFVALGITYSGYVVLSRERMLLDGMDALLIAIAVFALFAPLSETYTSTQAVLAKTLLGGLSINLMMNRLEVSRTPLALLCLSVYLAIFARSMV